MVFPDYTNSIINVMSSIASARNYNTGYPPLDIPNFKNLSESPSIILIIIDGMGYNYLQNHGKNSFLARHCVRRITSAFPTTTAACITSFLTGVPPQEHGITGWFLYLKELGMVTTILPFSARLGGNTFDKFGINAQSILLPNPIFDHIHGTPYMITRKTIINSPYTSALSGKSKKLGYNTLPGFTRHILQTVSHAAAPNYIYAYWPLFDSLSHKFGATAPEVNEHFRELDKMLEKLCNKLKKYNATVIITADHGMITADPLQHISLMHHPRLANTLTLPLSGDPRLAYCFVRPHMTKQFESYIDEHFHDLCTWHYSDELLEKGIFGTGTTHPRLRDRIGDYILIMKKQAIITDCLAEQTTPTMIGHHGSTSSDEMYVPLIIA